MASSTKAARPALFRRSFHKDYPVAVRGEGAWIIDAAGKRYFDLAGSAAVNFIGHGVAAVADAMHEQASQLEFVHSSQFVTPGAEEFAQEVLEFAGENFRGGAVYFTSGGSEAVETALKLARQYHVEAGDAKRHHIISRRQAYHGATLGAMAVSGNRSRREIYLPMMKEFAQISSPYCYRCVYDCQDCARRYAQELDSAIDSCYGETAAFIFEPMSGATLGAVAPPQNYFKDVSGIAKRHGLLLIADEVMTGWGRTGRNLAIEHWDVAPDIVTVAKGMTSGYAPLGAVIASARVADAIANGSGSFVHGFTYNAHPVAIAAGRAVLQQIREQGLVHRATSDRRGRAAVKPGQSTNDDATAGHALRMRLEALKELPSVGDVRGVGLLWGVEFVEAKATKQPFAPEKRFAARVAEQCVARGVLVYPMQGCVDGIAGDHLLIAPPAVATEAELSAAVGHLREAIVAASKNV